MPSSLETTPTSVHSLKSIDASTAYFSPGSPSTRRVTPGAPARGRMDSRAGGTTEDGSSGPLAPAGATIVVVSVKIQPPPNWPESLDESSTTYNVQAPFGVCPLKVASVEAYGTAGAGVGNVSPLP